MFALSSKLAVATAGGHVNINNDFTRNKNSCFKMHELCERITFSFFSVLEHISLAHAKKVGGKLSVRHGDKRTISDEKCKGSNQTCSDLGSKRELIIDREKAKKLGLCGNRIVKKGCFDNAQTQLGGKMLIDDEDKVHRTVNYSNNMHE